MAIRLLISAGAFALSLRPTVGVVYSDEESLAFRNEPLRQLNQGTSSALIVLARAITVAVVMFAISV